MGAGDNSGRGRKVELYGMQDYGKKYFDQVGRSIQSFERQEIGQIGQ